MIAVALLLVALVLSWFVLAGRTGGAFTIFERIHLALSPLPLVLMFGISLATQLLRIGPDGLGSWTRWLEPASIGLSAVLVVTGIALIWRRWARGEDRKGRLTAATLLAGIPVVLALLVVLFYGLRRNA